jgi:hypothetical protein
MPGTNNGHFSSGMRAAALLIDGTFRADVLLAGDNSFPESVRVAALERLADRCPPRRWPRIREDLAADPQTIWRERVLAAVAYVTWVLAPTLAPELFGGDVPPLFAADEALEAFATFTSAVVTDDVAAARRPSAPRSTRGLGWEPKPAPPPSAHVPPQTVTAAAEMDSDPSPRTLATCWHVATPAQRTLPEAHLQLLQQNPRATVSDAARAVGISAQAAHSQYARLKSKVS